MTLQPSKPAALRKQARALLVRRLIAGGLIVLAGVLVVLICAGAFLTYRITTTHDSSEDVTPAAYLLSSYESVNFADSNGTQHQGWLLIGLRGAPVIILCHGYNSNRSALLSLGTALQANHFNVYLFNFDGSPPKGYFSNLGANEASVLSAAIAKVEKLPGVNPHRIGLYGDSLGAYASLVAGERYPEVAALALDNAYSRPAQLFDVQLDRLVGGAGPLFRLLCEVEFRLLTVGTANPDVQAGLSRLAGKPKLFLASDEAAMLERSTRRLYQDAPLPKRLVVLPHTESDIVSGPEREEYEDQVLNFFLRNLPLRSD